MGVEDLGDCDEFDRPPPMVDTRSGLDGLIQLVRRIPPNLDNPTIVDHIRRNRWSRINVPLLWAAAGASDDVHPLVDWLCTLVVNNEGHCDFLSDTISPEALREGFWDLRTAFRCLGILTEQDLRTWLVNTGLVGQTLGVGCYINANAQEQIMDMAIREYPTVRRLETALAMATIRLYKDPPLLQWLIQHRPAATRRPALRRRRPNRPRGDTEGHTRGIATASSTARRDNDTS